MSAADEDERDSIPMNVEDDKANDDEEEDEGPPPFLPEQRVLCKDNDTTYYEAVVRKVRLVSANEWNFFVHYLGWNSRWDRWVDKETLVCDTPDNRKQYLTPEEPAPSSQQQSQQPSTSSQSKTKRKGQTESSSAKRRKSDASSSTVSYYQDYCELPFTLKTILVEEYEKITRRINLKAPHGYDCEVTPRPARSVHHLPATVTIAQILQHYQRKRGGSSVPQEKQEQVRRFCQALQSLFDEALPVCILYPQEQPQYQAILLLQQQKNSESPKSLSEIYGCEFLLRFLVRLPVLLQAEPNMESSLTFGPLITDLIVLLQKNRQACFKDSYREPKDDELLDWETALLLRTNDNDTTAPQSSSTSTKTTNPMER